MYRTGPLVAAIVMALALASCGGGGASSASTGTDPGAGSVAKVASSKDAADAKQTGDGTRAGEAKEAGSAAGCQAQLGEFVSRMTDLRQALLAGLSYAEYVVRVRAIRDAYEAVPVKKLGVSCLDGPAGDAEDAFNQYLRAANTWGECAGTEGCAASEIEGKLQRRWRIASKSLDQVQKG